MRALGWEVLHWDGTEPEATFGGFQPDLYMADVRYRHRVPRWLRQGRCQVVMTVDQWATPWAFPVLADYGYQTTRAHIRWVRRLDPVVLYHHASPNGIERGWSNWQRREGRRVISLQLAGDPLTFHPVNPRDDLRCDVGYMGQYNPYKAPGLHEYLLSYADRYRTVIFGSGWPAGKAAAESVSPSRRNAFLASATVVPCVHEPHGRIYGVEVTERLYKVPLAGGFTVTDPVSCIYDEHFFGDDEILMANDGREMAEIVKHFLHHPDERGPFIQRARDRVLAQHTYFHRIAELMTALGRSEEAQCARIYVGENFRTSAPAPANPIPPKT
ncbi:MAG: glycosyltransferase [Candidatus Dormibacteraeota bacterium]|uniref:Glycosyltransferase n=1 Tax=Candidatus Aeolococcus gillhamiae TaxID=3127015 RepID=A0A934N0W5_9BACT|nr:glycosyltransferase [Candidatus Dormibacteraeota bacterium]